MSKCIAMHKTYRSMKRAAEWNMHGVDVKDVST